VLNLGEFKAVLAHEFGHFAQRSMAVGRWVYIAQQIAGHIISARGVLDGFLSRLSRFDIRIAWVGWLLSTTIWSIRSLMETLFRLVILAQRALSREMEFQADLVAVSLTGSDALIHALHRLQAADDAWTAQSVSLQRKPVARGPCATYLPFNSAFLIICGTILGQPEYGVAPPRPQQQPEQHRVFKLQLAQVPRMWATHPSNTDREQNAKRSYVHAEIDDRSAWALFQNVPVLKEQMSRHVFKRTNIEPVPLEASLQVLDEQYQRAYLNVEYRGVYLGRSVVRHADKLWSCIRKSRAAMCE